MRPLVEHDRTAGRCPAYGRVRRDTQCLACSSWSFHHDWYRDLPPADELVEEAGRQSLIVEAGVLSY